jgi:Leucine rich repeat
VPSSSKKRVTLMVSPEEIRDHNNVPNDHSTISTSKRSADDDTSGNNDDNNNATKRKKSCWCNSTVIYSLFGVAITMTIVAVGINLLLYFDRQYDNAGTTTTTTVSPPSTTHDFSRPPSTTPSQGNDNNNGDPWLEMFSPSVSPNIPAVEDIATMILDIVTNQFRVELPNGDPMAPTNRAVQWLIDEAQDYHEHNTTQVYHTLEKFSQRFAVLVLYYALTTTASSSSSSSSGSTGVTVVNATLDAIPQRGLDECEWLGVTCDENDTDDDNDKMISGLDFSDWNLSGTIPPEIKFLPNLVQLDLSNNQLQGSLPEELFGLKRLQKIYLYQNQLSGTLSPSISQWDSLQVLHLSHNRFKGPIPEELQQSDEEGFRSLRKLG